MSHPIINIITRTSNRPNYFDQCYRSVVNQKTNAEIIHWVTVDDEMTEQYVTQEKYENARIIVETRPRRNNNAHFPYNGYINRVIHEAIDNDGWVIVLDDDDVLASDTSIEMLCVSMCEQSYDTNCVYFWNVSDLSGEVRKYGAAQDEDQITNNCFCFSLKAKNSVYFEFALNAERTVIKTLCANNRVIWIDAVLVKINNVNSEGGQGNRIDIDRPTVDECEHQLEAPIDVPDFSEKGNDDSCKSQSREPAMLSLKTSLVSVGVGTNVNPGHVHLVADELFQYLLNTVGQSCSLLANCRELMSLVQNLTETNRELERQIKMLRGISMPSQSQPHAGPKAKELVQHASPITEATCTYSHKASQVSRFYLLQKDGYKTDHIEKLLKSRQIKYNLVEVNTRLKYNQIIRNIVTDSLRENYDTIAILNPSEVILNVKFVDFMEKQLTCGTSFDVLFMCNKLGQGSMSAKEWAKLDFDHADYVSMYPDLKGKSSRETELHWKVYGQKEWRIPKIMIKRADRPIDNKLGLFITKDALVKLDTMFSDTHKHRSISENIFNDYQVNHGNGHYCLPNLTIPQQLNVAKTKKVCLSNCWHHPFFVDDSGS